MRHTILFLAADPSETDRHSLGREARAIQVELERSGYRDCFDFETRWAVEPLDLLRELRKLKPVVVHFSGRGRRNAAGRHRPGGEAPRPDAVAGEIGPPYGEQPCGLFLQNADGRPQLVSTAALAKTFGAVGASVKLVVLSACYTDVQAEALLAYVDCVVGMADSIHGDAARSFTLGFYGGLGEHEPIAKAYEQGRAAISLEGLPDGDRPQLRVRPGINPDGLVLAAPSMIPPSADATPAAHPATRTGPVASTASQPARRVSAVNYAEQGVTIQGDQIVHMAPATTEQEQEARYRKLERTRRRAQDELYLDDPMMKHRRSETTILRLAGISLALTGVVALALGQLLFGTMLLTGAAVGMHHVSRRAKHWRSGRQISRRD